MVRLKVLAHLFSRLSISNFNSSMVRLKGTLMRMGGIVVINFNSSMVRLKVVKEFTISSTNILFQFLYGAIKSANL